MDRVEPVSTVIDRETALIPAAGFASGIVSHLPVSHDLAAPEPPTYRDPWGKQSLIGAAVLLLCGLLLSYQIVFSPGDPGIFEVLADLVAVILLFWGPVAFLFWHKSQIAAARGAAIAASYPSWEHAKRVWNQLYYCHRDDGAYLPDGRSPLIPKDQIGPFCGFP
jgi:hypothetical protein